jgi:hypothetical protein
MSKPVVTATNVSIRPNFAGTATIAFRLPGWRKDAEFTVYPIKSAEKLDSVLIQSETRIARVDFHRGVGQISKPHANGAYAIHLSMDPLTTFNFGLDDLIKIKEAIAKTSSADAGMKGLLTFDNSGAGSILK